MTVNRHSVLTNQWKKDKYFSNQRSHLQEFNKRTSTVWMYDTIPLVYHFFYVLIPDTLLMVTLRDHFDCSEDFTFNCLSSESQHFHFRKLYRSTRSQSLKIKPEKLHIRKIIRNESSKQIEKIITRENNVCWIRQHEFSNNRIWTHWCVSVGYLLQKWAS